MRRIKTELTDGRCDDMCGAEHGSGLRHLDPVRIENRFGDLEPFDAVVVSVAARELVGDHRNVRNHLFVVGGVAHLKCRD